MHVLTTGEADHDAVRCSCFRLRRLTRRVTQFYDRHLAHAGVRTTQYSLLSHLRVLPGVAIGELADRMGLERTAMTRNLRPLIDAGWVATAPGSDPRRTELTLTASGRAQWSEAHRCWKAAQRAFEAALGDDALARLHAALAAAEGGLAAPAPRGSPAPAGAD